MPPQFSTSVLSAGVDTLTCSAPWEGGSFSFIDLAMYLQRDEAAHGSKTAYFKRGSYRGVQTRHVGLGFAPGRVLAELRGDVAHEFWPHFLDRAERVSRIDLEVSVKQHPYQHDMALQLYLADHEQARERGRPATLRMIGEAAGGTTLYIGKGASRYEARLYERFYKTLNTADREVWRYEVQARRERAQQLAGMAASVPDFSPWVQAVVRQHFDRRGVPPIFDSSTDVRVSPLPEAETDRDKSLRWLGSSVAPALERHRAWGSYDRAKQVLGIAD